MWKDAGDGTKVPEENCKPSSGSAQSFTDSERGVFLLLQTSRISIHWKVMNSLPWGGRLGIPSLNVDSVLPWIGRHFRTAV
jgi:hypothetical protein